METSVDGTSKAGQNRPNGDFEDDLRGLGSARRKSEEFRFSGSSGIGPSDRPWTGIDQPESQADHAGGIGSRLIDKLLEQRAEVLSRYDVVLQRKAEYEAKLEQIDRELVEARTMLAEALGLDEFNESESSEE